MKQSITTFLLFLLLFFALFLSCTKTDDGPIGLNRGVEGYGFYLNGILDSGRNFHPWGEDVIVTLDSVFVLTECAWNGYTQRNLEEYSTERSLAFRFDILLQDNGEASCASTGLDWDTSLVFNWSENWESLDTLIFFADDGSFLDDDKDVGKYVSVDTLVIAPGEITADTLSFARDSLWDTDHRSVLSTEDGRVLHRVKDTSIFDFVQMVRRPTCSTNPPTGCTQLTDTLYKSIEVSANDTLEIWLVKSCEEEILEYCANDAWVVDSTLTPEFNTRQDTTWTYHTVFVEAGQPCSYVNFYQALHLLPLSGQDSIRIYREWFHAESGSRLCANAPNPDTLIWDLDVDSLVLVDSLRLEILHDWQE